jgi:glycosyl transferase family 25
LIDVRVISLRSATDRRAALERQFSTQELDWAFFDAVEGVPADTDAVYDRELRHRLKDGVDLSRGELGCFFSHRTLWQRCAEAGRPLLILEDDVRIECDLKKVLALALEHNDAYDLLRLHGSIPRKPRLIRQLDDQLGLAKFYKDPLDTAAYLVKPETAAVLVRKSRRIFMTVDNFLAAGWIHRQRIRALYPYPVRLSTLHDSSTIGNRINPRPPLGRRIAREIRRMPYSWMATSFRIRDFCFRQN